MFKLLNYFMFLTVVNLNVLVGKVLKFNSTDRKIRIKNVYFIY